MWARTQERPRRAAQLVLAAAAIVGVRAVDPPVPDPAVDCVFVGDQATLIEATGMSNDYGRFDDAQGYSLAYLVDNNDRRQRNWHGVTIPGTSHEELSRTVSFGATQVFGFDIGTDGPTNDLCSIWLVSRKDDNADVMASNVQLYKCPAMPPSGNGVTTVQLTNAGCTHVVTREYDGDHGSDRGCEYRLDGYNQIDWTSCVYGGSWQGFPVPTGTRSRYYALYLEDTTDGNHNMRVTEWELYYAAPPGEQHRRPVCDPQGWYGYKAPICSTRSGGECAAVVYHRDHGGDCNAFCAFQGRPCVDSWDDTGNCLLYTSPSPRDRTRSRMPSSA